ncbi:unnamed protein product [Protopolystoma xenopodis]|uniref:Uncharacterized protein n=1 Tax=Protopolystoma xenopodis TaxID=117903 RepID=A0A448XQ41_9PLAT|nr:unnamed protein product [Protopolystoma xenopodis]
MLQHLPESRTLPAHETETMSTQSSNQHIEAYEMEEYGGASEPEDEPVQQVDTSRNLTGAIFEAFSAIILIQVT